MTKLQCCTSTIFRKQSCATVESAAHTVAWPKSTLFGFLRETSSPKINVIISENLSHALREFTYSASNWHVFLQCLAEIDHFCIFFYLVIYLLGYYGSIFRAYHLCLQGSESDFQTDWRLHRLIVDPECG